MFAVLLLLYSFIYLNLHRNIAGSNLFFLVSSFLILVTLWKKPTVPDNILIKPLVLFNIFILLSVPFSSYIRISLEFYEYLFKIQLITFCTYAILNSSKKIYYFIIVLLSYHLIVVKNTLSGFSISQASHRYGASGMAESSFMGDANDFALALNIMLPFALYLMLYTKNIALKISIGLIFCSLIAGIVISNSRGGFITLTGVLLYLVLQSKRKLL